MADILDKLNEALSKEKLMRHIKWEEYIWNFFNTYDFFMNQDASKNVNIKNGQKAAEKSMMMLSQFFDSTPVLDTYRKQWEKEQKKISRF